MKSSRNNLRRELIKNIKIFVRYSEMSRFSSVGSARDDVRRPHHKTRRIRGVRHVKTPIHSQSASVDV